MYNKSRFKFVFEMIFGCFDSERLIRDAHRDFRDFDSALLILDKIVVDQANELVREQYWIYLA